MISFECESLRNNLNLISPISAKQAAKGMCYLEDNKVVHRDISLRNFLVCQLDDEPYFVKVADFGLSRAVVEDYYKGNEGSLPIRWTAPEALEFGKFTTKSDVWSFGIMLWELFSKGKKTYVQFSNHETIEQVLSGYTMDPPEDCPPEIAKLMKRCWNRKPADRPSFKVQHDANECSAHFILRKFWNA